MAATAEHTVYLEHSMRGRARLRVPRPRTPHQVLRAAGRIGRSRRVKNVEANPTTGSLLITFDPDDPLDLIVEELGTMGVAVESAMRGMRPVKTQSRGAVVVRHVMAGANAKLHQVTQGNIDLKLVVPAIYMLLAIRNFTRQRGSLRNASWHQLAYWAFDSFFKLHDESTVRDVPRTHGRVVD